MPSSSSFRLAVRMAVREARASRLKFAFAALSMTVAVAGVFGVRSVAAGFAKHAGDNARQLIAADATAIYFGPPPTDEQLAAVRDSAGEGNATVVTEAHTMAASDESPDPALVSIKAVDPKLYPFYGQLGLASGRSLASVLDEDSVVVEKDLLDTLQVRLGDSIRLNGVSFRIRDIIDTEPDRLIIPPVPLSRVVVSDSGFDRARVGRFADAFHRVLVRTPNPARRLELCGRLEQWFPDAEVIDFTTPTPQMTAAAEWVAPFLNVLALLTLVFGAVGIAVAAYFHLLQRLDSIAVLKSVGATTAQILMIYFLQVGVLALVSVGLGIAGGRLVEFVLTRIAARYFSTPLTMEAGMAMVAETCALCLLASAVAAWVPLSKIRTISPSALLRRDAGEKGAGSLEPESNTSLRRLALTLGGVTATLLLFHMVDSRQVRLYFVFGLIACFTVLFGLAHATLATFVHVIRAAPARVPFALRQAVTNLHRYRRQSRTVIVALSAGVALMLIAILGQRQLSAQILGLIPFRAPNLLFLDLSDSQRNALSNLLTGRPGVASPPEFIPTAWLTLVRAGNSTLENLRQRETRMWIQKSWPASCLAKQPDSVPLIAGEWRAETSGSNAVALDQSLANLLGAGIGTELDFATGGHPFHARVAALLHLPATQQIWWHQILFIDCQTLPGLSYNGGVAVDPPDLTSVRDMIRSRAPDVTMMEVGDLVARAQAMGAEAGRIVELIAILVACSAGCLLLAVTNSLRAFRVRDIAILRAVGARRSTLLTILSFEYVAIGGLAGFMGALLGCGAAGLILRQVTGTFAPTFDLPGIVVSTALAAVLAMLVGLAGSIPLLRPRPLEVLRKQ